MMGAVERRITVFSQVLARLDEALARPEDAKSTRRYPTMRE